MDRLEEIKNKIRTINPDITDELLDLLYEFIIAKHTTDITKCLKNPDLESILQYVINPVNAKNN